MVRGQVDTVDALMAHYVAGSLPLAAHVLVASHLEMKDDNRFFVGGLEALAAQALEELDPAPFSHRDQALAAIFSMPTVEVAQKTIVPQAASGLPRALRDFVGMDLADIPWRTRLPGFKEYDLGEIDGLETSLFWIRPGRAIPAHTHRGVELSLILEGAFKDTRGRFGPGDISVADDSVDHRPIAEKERPCIGFAVVDQPLKFTGSLTQMLGDLIG